MRALTTSPPPSKARRPPLFRPIRRLPPSPLFWPLVWFAGLFGFLAAVAVITPPWQNSDEPLHMARVVQIAHGELLGWREWTTSGGMSDHAVYAAYLPLRHVAMHTDERPTAVERAESEATRWSRALEYTSFPNTVQYPPLFYLPDVAGYWLGRAAGMRIDATLRLCRVLNAAAFAALTAAALALAARTRWLIAALLLLPMTLSLGASAAQDGPMIGAVALAVALADRAAARGACPAPVLAGIATLLAAAGMARPPYAGFLLLLPGLNHPRRWLAFAIATVAVAAWCGLVAARVMVPFSGSDAAAQAALLADDPARIVGLVARTAGVFGLDYWRQFIGRLGWTDTPLPTLYYWLATAALAAPWLAAGDVRPRLARLALLGTIFAVVTIFVLQYLTWSHPGQPVITGVLGRYFIPVALVLALAAPRLRRTTQPAAIASVALLAAVTPPVMIASLLARYAEH